MSNIFTKAGQFLSEALELDSAERGVYNQTPLQKWRQASFPHNLISEDINVTYESSLSVSYVYAAVNAISSDIASIHWAPYKVDSKGVKMEAKEHDQYKLLTRRPYFAYNSTTFIRAWVANYLLTGDGIAQIVRDERTGRPKGYRLWHKKDVQAFINHKEEMLTYVITGDGEKLELPYTDVLHLSDLSLNGLFGYSKIGLARKSIEIAMRMDKTQNDVQKEGTFLGGVLSIDKVLTQEQAKTFRESWNEQYANKKGGIAVLEAGAKFTPFTYSMTMADAEFIASRKFTGEEILRFFRFPMHMANSLERSTNNNIEQQALEYVNYTLRPIVELMENEFNNKIFKSSEQDTHYVQGNLNSLLRGDIESRVKLYETLWKLSGMTANEARREEGMNPTPYGDITYADLNKMPTSQVIELYEAKIKEIQSKTTASQ